MAPVILRYGAMTVTLKHLSTRPKDGLLFYRRRVPKDVAAHFPGKTTRIRVEHSGDSEDMAPRANLEAARLSCDHVEVMVTVAGWFRPDGKL